MLTIATLPGCRSLFGGDGDMWTPAPDRLRVVEPLDLDQYAPPDPVPLDVAAEQAIADIVDPPAPPELMPLTLVDVRAAALANNLDLQVELISPSIAQAALDAEQAKFESVFTFDFLRARTDTPVILGTEGSRSTFTSFDPGVRIPLRTGGTANISLPFSETETNNPFSLLNPAYQADLRFSISQPLLRNAGTWVNTYSIRVAKHQRSIAGARTKLETIRVLAAAERAYWRLYAAQRELEVRQQEYELAVTQFQSAQRRVEAGAVAEIEITRAESGVAERLEAIIIAETNVRRARRDLKRLMNRRDLPMSSPTAFTLETQPDPVHYELEAEELAAFAVENRMEMLELELQLAIDASTIGLRKNEKLPLVLLDYSYSINGLGDSYDAAFDQIPDRSFEDWSIGVRAEIPLGNVAAKARLHEAVLRRLQRLATRDQRRFAIRQEVYDAVDQLQQSWQRILAARQAAITAARTLLAEQNQFGQGIRTSTDVLDASARLADAQSREIQALVDYQIAQVDIAFATGTLLGYERVRWEPIDLNGDD